MELKKSLNEKIYPLYNLKGEDFFLIKQAINLIKSVTITDLEEFNYVKLEAEKLKSNDILIQLETLPIASNYRLVVLENPSAEIVKFLNKYEFTSELVVVCVNADKLTSAETVDCSKLDRADLTKYILNYMAKQNLSIEERALDYLIDATGGAISQIVNELNKISAYALETNVVDINMATNLVSNSSEYVIYMLTNAIDSKDYASYQSVLNSMSKSQTYNEIFSYLGKYFKRMQYVAINKDDGELSTVLGIKPYAVKLARQNVSKNGVKYYISLYEKYIDLDYRIKSGKISTYNALFELIF